MIPTFNDGQTLMEVRTRSINPVIEKVNGLTDEVLSIDSTIKTLNTKMNDMYPDLVQEGVRHKVDHRVFKYSTTSNFAGIAVDLDANEFPVRAVTRSYDTVNKLGTFNPAENLTYDRTTQILTAKVGTVKNGELFVEFWGRV